MDDERVEATPEPDEVDVDAAIARLEALLAERRRRQLRERETDR